MLKVVQIIPDDRDMFQRYDLPEPFFGAAPTALLEGFRLLGEKIEIHVVACVRKEMPVPFKLAGNIFYHQVLVRGGYRRTLFIQAVRKIRKKLKEINPDIVHGQGTEDYPGISAAFSGYPNCITLHGNMRAVARKLKCQPFPQMVVTVLGEIAALLKTDAVICNSAYTEQCVGRLNSNKVRIPNAVRSSFFNLRLPISDLRSPTSVPVLLCFGTVVPYKNQIGLIHALDPVAHETGLRLIFAGRCPPDNRYAEQFLAEVKKRDWCKYAGHLETEELQPLLKNCAGVIHPTLEDSFGLAVVEAQAAGVPVAASSVGGLPGLIEDGVTGFLFDPTDIEDIQKKITALLDKSIATQLASNATESAKAKYNPKVIAEKHYELYSRILEQQATVHNIDSRINPGL